ncbi:MAG: DMT family transporter [Oscillospiraceae bacterium]|nr:DMT family transporter [Oscillospiraceae bacterium]
MKQTQNHGHLMALICVLIWGSTFVVSKQLLVFLQPVQLMLLRFAMAYIALSFVYPKFYFKPKEEWRFLLMALFANTLYCWAENTAITLTQASNVSILVSTSPIMTAVTMALLHKEERLKRMQLLGFAIAFAGVVLVVFNGAVSLHLNPAGDMLALLAAALWAAYGFLLRRWSGIYDSVLITKKLMFYGFLSTLPLVLMQGKPIDFGSLFVLENLLMLAFLGLVGSAGCYMLWSIAVKKIGVLSANLYINMIPLVTLLVSAAALGEKITLMGLCGMVLVISGMVLGTVEFKNKKAEV